MSISTLTYNTDTYDVLSGTSMSAPLVSGLAALLFSHNPSYTYSDVVNAILSGGVTVSTLAHTIGTGKVVNAMGSLSYINAPQGVTATTQ